MSASLIAAAVLSALAAPQTMDHAHMPGMTMPAPAPVTKPKPARRAPAAKRASQTSPAAAPTRRAPTAADKTDARPSCAPEHAAMGHCAGQTSRQPEPDVSSACPPEHAAMGHCVPKATGAAEAVPQSRTEGTALSAGNAPAPAAPAADYADRIWGRAAMAPAREALRREHGGMRFSQVMIALAEARFRQGDDSFRWDGAFRYGGDVNRLVVESEGDAGFHGGAEGDIQALYSRAIDPYFNLQAGVRQDFGRARDRTYATVGIDGLAPYWFDVEAALFLSDRGEVTARIESAYDQRVTQRLILQPRIELDLSAQDLPGSRLGSGITDAEIGLRLRRELAREFAPYVGIVWERKFGDTARFARADGEGSDGFSVVLGARAWF